MTRLLGFDPLQRATEFICRLMLEAGACVRKCPEGQTIAGGWAHVGAGACVRREGRARGGESGTCGRLEMGGRTEDVEDVCA